MPDEIILGIYDILTKIKRLEMKESMVREFSINLIQLLESMEFTTQELKEQVRALRTKLIDKEENV